MKVPRRVALKPGSELFAIAEDVQIDREPRVLEKAGVGVAAIVSIDDFDRMLVPNASSEGMEKALSAAGAWRDFDTDDLIERIYRARHEGPPSQPVEL